MDLNSSRLLNTGPFRFGFIMTLGILLAVVLGLAIGSLGYPLTLTFLALFISLGLHPVVLKLESRRLSRGLAVLTVMVVFVVVVALLVWMIVPVITTETAKLIRHFPNGIDGIERAEWFISINSSLGGALLPFVELLQTSAADPNVWLTVSGGALRVGANILSGTIGVLFVVALTLYFVGSMESMKRGLYSLVPASKRVSFVEIAEQIFVSVGKYLTGMFLLAVMNGTFTFILLSIAQVPYAALLAVFAVPITFIPVVGSLINTAIVTVVSLFTSPQTGLVVLIFMFIYMQVEAYVFTPRIVGRAIRIPGQLVLIGAMVGATLLGLLGALVACPVTASILLILKKVVVPAQETR